MLTMINMTTSPQDLERFENQAHLKNFYRSLGIDGIELMMVGGTEIPEKVPKEDVVGVHLSFLPFWYAFWKEDREALLQIFGEEKKWEEYYGGKNREVLVENLKKELDEAEKMQAKYVVFHVSESDLEECLTYKMKHSDEEICDAACEIINAALDSSSYHFEFLCENLWWSGFTMQNPKITERLMNGICYGKKGIMLDTGHLLHTNRALRTQEEAIEYIHEILKRHGTLCRYIRGIHLQQSLSGEYVEDFLKKPLDLKMTYEEKINMVYLHIFQIDRHEPFTASGVVGLIQRISPKYLTYELITENNEIHLKRLKEQLLALETLKREAL